jgi:alpha-beta hydrolase superfamily lysophospholipase
MPDLVVTKPMFGDTFAQGGDYEEKEVEITWTTPDTLADRPAVISLVQGYNESLLAIREVINGTFSSVYDM